MRYYNVLRGINDILCSYWKKEAVLDYFNWENVQANSKKVEVLCKTLIKQSGIIF